MRIHIAPLFMVGLILVQSINLAMIRINFEIHRDFIAKNFCINRFNPDSDCKGSCVLMKKLHAETEQEANHKATFNPLLTFTFYFEDSGLEKPIIVVSNSDKKHKTYFKSFWKEPFIEISNPPPIIIS